MENKVSEEEYKVGDKIRFVEEKRPYIIQARNARFLICTKPFNLKSSVMYTIVDLEENIRGTENLVFGMGFENKSLCEEALKRLSSRETEVSHRNRIALNIDKNKRNIGKNETNFKLGLCSW